jgi:hypothetical protein
VCLRTSRFDPPAKRVYGSFCTLAIMEHHPALEFSGSAGVEIGSDRLNDPRRGHPRQSALSDIEAIEHGDFSKVQDDGKDSCGD